MPRPIPALGPEYPLWLAGEPVLPPGRLEVLDKFDGRVAARVGMADAALVDAAIAAAVGAQEPLARLAAYERKAALEHVVRRLDERHEELASVLAVEAGKPITDARGEVTRTIDTFTLSAEEATRIGGEWQSLDISPRAKGYQSITKRVPIGPVSFISPFNFPLNLVAHKVGPAIAVGCPFVLKPASRTPISALILGEILAETQLPKGSWSILPAAREAARALTEDERLKLLSFTGSPKAGWDMKRRCGKKPIILELGGNAASIVERDADVDRAVDRIVVGAFYQSGQSCISVQRIFVHRSIQAEFTEKLVRKTRALVAGDPLDEATFLGPLISTWDAERVESWVARAVEGGARVLCGGERDGAFYAATLVEQCPADVELSCQEVFGPVATLEPFDDFQDVCAQVNDSAFGLQAGVFTRDLGRTLYAFDHLAVGGVVINDVPSIRVDSMPYGGVKDSGLGREGVRSAIEHLTEPRLLVWQTEGLLP